MATDPSAFDNPYVSPQVVDPRVDSRGHIPAGKTWVELRPFRSPRRLAAIWKILAVLALVHSLATAVLSLLEFKGWMGEEVAWDGSDDLGALAAEEPLGGPRSVQESELVELGKLELSTLDLVNVVFLLVGAIIYLCERVLFWMWTYRCHTNLPVLGATRLRFTHGWSVGWFFIPVASLYKPYQVFQEIWRASDARWIYEGQTRVPRTPRLMLAWWLMSLFSTAGNQFSIRVGASSDDPNILHAFMGFDAFLGFFDVVLALLAIWLVTRITTAQEAKQENTAELTSVYFA